MSIKSQQGVCRHKQHYFKFYMNIQKIIILKPYKEKSRKKQYTLFQFTLHLIKKVYDGKREDTWIKGPDTKCRN